MDYNRSHGYCCTDTAEDDRSYCSKCALVYVCMLVCVLVCVMSLCVYLHVYLCVCACACVCNVFLFFLYLCVSVCSCVCMYLCVCVIYNPEHLYNKIQVKEADVYIKSKKRGKNKGLNSEGNNNDWSQYDFLGNGRRKICFP